MNHIYKSIFNKALGVFTAVPEFASAHGKGSERTVVGRVAKGTAGFAASALAISIGLALSSNAMANVDTDVASGVLRIADTVTHTNSIRMGTGTTLDDANKTWNSISIGVDAGVNTVSSIAIGDGAKAGGKGTNDPFGGDAGLAIGHQAQALGTGAVALGQNASVKDGHDSVAIGVYSQTTNQKTVSIGAYNEARGVQSTVIGSNYDINNNKTAVSIASGTRSQIIGVQSTVSGDNSVSIGDTNTIASARTYALGNNINVAAGADDSLVFGTKANVSAANAIAMGSSAKARTDKSVALGENALAGDPTAPTVKKGEYSTAIGSSTSALGYGATAIGSITKAKVNYATALGHEAEASGTGETSLGYGAGANSASPNGNRNGVNVGTNAGRYAISGGNNVAVGISAGQYVEGDNNIAQGYSAGYYIKGNENVSIGTNANVGSATEKLKVSKTVAIGSAAKASANNAAAMGTQAAASGSNSAAIGLNAKATTDSSIAIGTSSEAGGPATSAALLGTKAVAIGYETKALGTSNVALGYGSVAENGHDSIAIGIKTKTSNVKSIAIGAYSEASGAQSTVISDNYGSATGAVSTASGTRSQVYGAETNVSGDNSVAIGDTNTVASARTYVMGNNINAAAGTNDSLAFGTKAGVGGANAIALGNTAKATQDNSIAQGTESATYGKNSVSIGYKAISGLTAPTATQTNAFSVSIGNETEALDASTIAIGDKAKAKGGVDALAVGTQANAMTYKALAIGAYSQATGRQSTVIGNDIQGQPSIASGTRSQIIGVQSNVSGDNSVSIGDTNTIASARTYAIGNNINVAAGADDSLAFGTRAAVGAANTVAIGANANAAQANSVALGAGSATSAPNKGDHTLNGSYTAAGLPDAANGTVSVGSAGKERQIQNVAAGVISATSTDAINGSQLYATNNYLSNLAGGVKNVLGGNAAVDNAGNVTMSNIGGTGKGNVNDAIAAANTKVAAGDNITVTPTTNTDGSKTYTVATKKDLVVDSVKAGDTTVNTNGVTITGGPSVTKTGINAGDKKITNVAPGTVAAGSKDAVNGGQLAEVKAKADSAVQNVVSANPTALTATKAGDTVTLTPNFIAGDLVNADGTVKDPAAADEGKLVSAKTVADALKANHFVVDTKANGGKVETGSEADAKVGSGNKVTFEAGKNLVAQQTNTANGGATVNYKLSDTLENLVSVKSAEIEAGIGPNKVVLNNNGVKVGDSTLNDKGLTINNGPSVTDAGINAGDKKITGVANGNVAAGSTDAVNGGQLAEVKSKADSAVQDVKSGDENALTAVKDPNTNIVTVTPKLSGDLVDTNGNITAPTTPEEKGKLVTAGTVAEALANTHFVVDTKATDGELDAASQADQKIKASNKVTLQAGKNLKAKQTNGADGAQVEFSLKDSISLTQVTAGEGDNQVVLGNDGVKVGGNTYINKDGLNANNKPISNVADGVKPTDAVNKGQLDAVKGVADSAVKSVDVANGEQNLVVDNTDPKNLKLSLKKDLTVNSVKAGDSTLNTDGLTIAGGPSVKKDGINAGDKTITNVAPGAVTPTSKDAVNGSQLYNVANNVKDLIGPDATIDPATGKVTVADPAKGIGETGKGNINDAIKSVNDLAKKAAAEKTSVKAKEGRSNVTVTEGINAAGGHEYTVDVERSVTNAGSDYVTVTNNHDADSNTTTYTVDVSAKTKASLAKADSAVQGLTSKDGNLNFTKGANGNVEVSFNDNLNVKNVTTDRVQVANGPSMSKDGINAAGKAISNVANGNVAADSKDAVNGGQLHETAKSVADVIGGGATVKDGKVVAGQNGIGNTGQNTVHGAIAAINQNTANNFNQIRGDLRKMDRDLRGGIAGALATAGLPQAFRPGKSMVAAAASTYRGQSGLAIGVSRISDNGKVILKVTGNTNSRGDFGGTIGAGYQW